jgi:D-threo-aldose 1-dehydrogenase
MAETTEQRDPVRGFQAGQATPGPGLNRRFGATGLSVPPLCLGAAPLADMEGTFGYAPGEERALETVRAVFRSEITFLDTAASYGDGESERRIGIVIRELGGVPDGYLVATKADRDAQSGDFSGPQMRRSVERSLRLLGMERLPLLYLHDPEHASFEEITAPGGALEVLTDLQREGAIGALGVAGGPVDLMMRYVETGAFGAMITHNRYTLVNQSAAPLLELAASRGLGVCNAAPYGSGILAKGPDAYPRYAYQDADDDVLEGVRRMEAICEEHGVPLAAAALQFSMRDPRVVSTIVGMTRPERISQTLELARHPIPDELWGRLAAASVGGDDPEANRWS